MGTDSTVAATAAETLLGRLRLARTLPLAGVVLGGTLLAIVFGLPVQRPRIFGDELIYWELSRSFAWTGHFLVRGGVDPGYGVVYPAFLAVAHRLGGNEAEAYAVARLLDALVFSLVAIPTYAVARRVVNRESALLAAGVSVTVPGLVYTSTIMTENVFYPATLFTVLTMLWALEEPSRRHQLVLVAACAALFLVRAQAVVMLPAFWLAAFVLVRLDEPAGWAAALRLFVARFRLSIGLGALAAAAATVLAAASGRSVFGAYHVLLGGHGSPLSLLRWALANAADIELYVGVVPFAALALALVHALRGSLSAELRRVTVLTASVGAALLATVAVLSASPYGLGRIHERNLFPVAPLIVIVFLASSGRLARRGRAAVAVAVAVTLLPLAIPPSAVTISANDDALALVWWNVSRLSGPALSIALAAFALCGALIFLRGRRPVFALQASLLVGVVILVGGELHAGASGKLAPTMMMRTDAGWIDGAVGPTSNVVEILPGRLDSERIHDVWQNEFFNRSVRDVYSAVGKLPDGLPVRRLVRRGDCLVGRASAAYAVVPDRWRLNGVLIARSAASRSLLYRLRPSGSCVAVLASPL